MSLKWISNQAEMRNTNAVSIDVYHRLNILKTPRKTLNIPDNELFQLIVGFDKVNKRIVLAKPDVVRVPNVRPYKFSRRATAKVSNFVKEAGLEDRLPVRFNYVGKDFSEYPQGAHAFQLEGFDAPDDTGTEKD